MDTTEDERAAVREMAAAIAETIQGLGYVIVDWLMSDDDGSVTLRIDRSAPSN
jgi:D-alanine-D-alanine ligase-like ATP-grasp enzyme